jgi:hypothetical protein
MKKLLTATALAALLATPAFATTYRSHAYRADSATEAYASVPGLAYAGSQPVFADGKMIGADPDANVRMDLARQWGLQDR